MAKITQETRVVEETMQFANDYKYVNARGGQVGVTVLETGVDQQFVVVHAVAVQFHPDSSIAGQNTKPVRCALASLELDVDSAKTLHALLGHMLNLSGNGSNAQ